MATYTSEIVTRIIRRWIVPAAEPWGAAAEEIAKAWAAAESGYRDAHKIPAEQSVPGGALRFHVTDDAIVISFETDTPA